MDKRVGDIIQTLKDNDLYENTIIVFAGDNGLAVGQHGLMGKQNVYEHSIGVPLMIKAAAQHTGKKTADLCYLIDVFPTLCDMLQLPVPRSVDGVSLLSSIKGGRPIRDHLYYCYMDNQRSISDGIWKLIEYHVNGERTTQLFKLKDDPWEMNNLSGQKKYRKIIQRLREKMIEDQRKTNDTSIFWNNFSY